MKFTFYGDLLGLSSAYKLGASTAYEKLNAFYNETFQTLDEFCDAQGNDVEMYSDSLFIKGDDALSAMKEISKVFARLLRNGLLLQGSTMKRLLP